MPSDPTDFAGSQRPVLQGKEQSLRTSCRASYAVNEAIVFSEAVQFMGRAEFMHWIGTHSSERQKPRK